MHSGECRATSPAPPSVLYQCGWPNPFHPQSSCCKTGKKGWGTWKSPRNLSHVCNLASPLRQTHQRHLVAGAGHSRRQCSSSPPSGDFPKSRSFDLKSQGLCEQSLSLGSTGHRGTEALGWGLIPIKGEHPWEPLGTQVRMLSDPVCCLTLLSLLLSVPTSVNPSEAPPTLNIPVCGSTL